MGQVFRYFILIGFISGCSTSAVQGPKNYTQEEKARMLVEVANGALAEKDATGALQSLAQAELLDDSLPELHHSRALAFYIKDEKVEALKSARRAVELKPSYADANNTLGKILMDLGQLKDAQKYLKIAANDSLNREAYKAKTSLGLIEYRASRYAEAEVFFNQAIRDAPGAACVAYFYRGEVLSKTKRVKEAVKDYSNATRNACTHFADAYLALGLAYQRTGQYPLARKTFVEVQKRYPNTRLAEQAMDQLRYLP